MSLLHLHMQSFEYHANEIKLLCDYRELNLSNMKHVIIYSKGILRYQSFQSLFLSYSRIKKNTVDIKLFYNII